MATRFSDKVRVHLDNLLLNIAMPGLSAPLQHYLGNQLIMTHTSVGAVQAWPVLIVARLVELVWHT